MFGKRILRKFSKLGKEEKKVVDYVVRNNQVAKYALLQFLDSQKALSDLEKDEKYSVNS